MNPNIFPEGLFRIAKLGPPPLKPKPAWLAARPEQRVRSSQPAAQSPQTAQSSRPAQSSKRAQPQIVIAVMGITGAGKSTFIRKITGLDTVKVGNSVLAETQNVAVCKKSIAGRTVCFIDTPGFDDTYRNDTEVLELVGAWLARAYTTGVKINGIIYLHRITDNRMQGGSRKNLKMFQKLIGEHALTRVTLATTMWDLADPSEGAKREAELQRLFWDRISELGMKARRVDTDGMELAIVLELMDNHEGEPLLIQRELMDEGKSLKETTAGQEVQGEVRKATAVLTAELEEIAKQLQDMRVKGEYEMKRLREEQWELQKELASTANQRAALEQSVSDLTTRLSTELAVARAQTEIKITEMNLKLAQEQEARAKAEIAAREAEIAALETELVGINKREVQDEEYNKLVREYNELLVKSEVKLEAERQDYKALVEKYNNMVRRKNDGPCCIS